MSATVSVSLGSLIDEALEFLYRESERPFNPVVGTDSLSSAGTDVTLTLQDSTSWDAVNPSDLLEHGSELMLVTAKSSDATPVFTVSRGYLGTTPEAAATGDVLNLNPQWSRVKVRRAVLRCVRNALVTALPQLVTTEVTLTTGLRFLELPDECDQAYRVSWYDSRVGQWDDLHGWAYDENVPTSLASSGKIIRLDRRHTHLGGVAGPSFFVTYGRPYTWAWTSGMVDYTSTEPAVEEAVTDLPLAGSNLPVLYAAGYLLLGREVTRSELDKVEEWNQEAAIRQGINLRMVQMAWSEYFRELDEARKARNVPRHRTYRSMGRL